MLESSYSFNLHDDVILAAGLPDVVNATVIGQEQDGVILYTYNQRQTASSRVGGSAWETVISAYDPSQKISKVLYVCEREVKVVNATISQEHAFLGYVVLEETFSSGPGGKKYKKDVYYAYLTELQGERRLFNLNLDRPHYIKLQFLYGNYKGQVTNRETHLLIFLHKESIALYHFPLARIGDKGWMVSEEPKKDTVFYKTFIWSQWDAQGQRLHLVAFKKIEKAPSGQKVYKPFLTCYQFNENTIPECMVELQLDLPIPHTKSSKRSSYFSPGPWQCIPDTSVNLHLLTQTSGAICLCYQHQVEEENESKRKSHKTEIHYSVCLLHHGKTLHCQGPMVPHQVAAQGSLLFAWLGDHLLVHLSGVFTHLLNVSAEFEPVNHILHHELALSCAEEDSRPFTVYSTFFKDRSVTGAGCSLQLFDVNKQQGVKLQLDRESLITMFNSKCSQERRYAIINYLVIHLKDLTLVKQCIEALEKEEDSTNTAAYLEEFLVASTYMTLRRQTEKTMAKYFPFTTRPTFHSLIHRNQLSERQSSISYIQLKPAVIMSRQRRPERPVVLVRQESLWTNHEKVARSLAPERLSNHHIKALIDSMPQVSQEQPRRTEASTGTKISSHQKSDSTHHETKTKSPTKIEQLLGPPPPFLADQRVRMSIADCQRMEKVSEAVTSHLQYAMPYVSLGKFRNMASEYIQIQIQQTQLLSHIIWSIFKMEHNQNLTGGAEEGELELFAMWEHFFLAVERLAFIGPPGFSDYFTTLGFRCLKPRLFFQYLDHQVFKISQEFAQHVIQALDDSTESIKIKLQVISRLSPSDAHSVLGWWEHPVTLSYRQRLEETSISTPDDTWEACPPVMYKTGST